ncbi:MAG: UvrB/UvrC motif-containing protein [Candidatus Handelsmanbacteria bacterium]|nr:UvrB/UvrC motif-containing protein [Candidatus Handelsmanbacteria bacterium]
MPHDIDHILREWEYDPQANVRRIWGEDGAQKLQVRVDQGAFQGIMQLNLDGRPDGKRPYGFEFALDYHREALEKYRQNHGGQPEGFSLDHPACQELFDEGARVYGRYVFLLQLKDYPRVIRDTERNMGLFRFVNTHAETEEDRNNLERWWPYILRINATARALKTFQEKQYATALEIAAAARIQIEQLPEVQAEEFFVEKERSLQALDELAEELTRNRPLSEEELLQHELQEAIAQEQFERAAALRDQLRQLRDPRE